MSRDLYTVICRIAAVFVFLEGLKSYLWIGTRWLEPLYKTDQTMISFILENPNLWWQLATVITPSILYWALSIWLWRAPNFPTDNSSSKAAPSSFMYSGIKLIGLYFLVSKLPELFLGIYTEAIGLSDPDITRHTIVAFIQTIVGFTLIFRSRFVMKLIGGKDE